jgi:hypothetical protein
MYFLTRFDGFQDYFVLIGGTACDLWMGDNGLEFRATKDLDIVIVAESLSPEFFQRFWEFVAEGQYASLEQSESRPSFYRFKNPLHADHPKMMELFTRNYLEVPKEYHLTPVPAEQDISSLSAILLGDDYYNFILSSRVKIDGVPTIPVQCLILLKARAFLDLVKRREDGEHIDSRQIKKHRNDVFNLYRTLAPADRHQLPETLASDLSSFLEYFPEDADDWPAINAAVPDLPPPGQIANQLRENFGLVP